MIESSDCCHMAAGWTKDTNRSYLISFFNNVEFIIASGAKVLTHFYSFYKCAPVATSFPSSLPLPPDCAQQRNPAPDCQGKQREHLRVAASPQKQEREREKTPLGCFNSFSSAFSFPLRALRPWAPLSEEITAAQSSFVMLRPQPSAHQPSAGSRRFLEPRPTWICSAGSRCD